MRARSVASYMVARVDATTLPPSKNQTKKKRFQQSLWLLDDAPQNEDRFYFT